MRGSSRARTPPLQCLRSAAQATFGGHCRCAATWHKFGRSRAKSGPIQPRFRAILCRSQQTLVDSGPKTVPNLLNIRQHWPIPSQIWSIWAWPSPIWFTTSKFGRYQPSLVEVGPKSGRIHRCAPIRPNFGRRRPNFVKLGPTLAELGSFLAEVSPRLAEIGGFLTHLGQSLSDSNRTRCKFGRHRTRFIQFRSIFWPSQKQIWPTPAHGQPPATCAPPSFRKGYCATWHNPPVPTSSTSSGRGRVRVLTFSGRVRLSGRCRPNGWLRPMLGGWAGFERIRAGLTTFGAMSANLGSGFGRASTGLLAALTTILRARIRGNRLRAICE